MLHLIKSGRRLLTGTRRECKEYIKLHNLENYQITDTFIEKVATPKGAFDTKPFYKRLFTR